MTLRNRVTPLGDLVADPGRGLVYGNRGCLHDPDGTIRRRYNGRRWIACQLQFRGRRRAALLAPGRYTELFFLDEATAFAAGHRPCAECRRPDYVRLMAIWEQLHPAQHGADAIDAQLHSERLEPGRREQRHHEAELAALPDGVFVLREDAPWLVRGGSLLRYTPAGYVDRAARPARGPVTVITPASLVAVLGSGWEPMVALMHPTAAPPDG